MKKYNYVGWCMAGSLGLSAMSGQAAQPEKKQPHIPMHPNVVGQSLSR